MEHAARGSSGEEPEALDYDVTALTQNLEGNIVVGVTTGENPKVIEYANTDGSITGETTISANVEITDMDGYNSQDVIIVSQGLNDTITGRIDLYSNGSVNLESELDFNANAVARLDNGKAIIVGNYTETAQEVSTKGNYDGIIIEYDINSSTINSSKFIRGTLDEVLTSVTKTTDGGYMVGGYTYSSKVDFNQEETTWEIPSISGYSDGFVIKYDAEGNQIWYKQVTGDNLDEVTGVTERDENEFVAVGYFNSTTVKGDTADAEGISLSKYSDGFIFNFGEIITAPEVPESSEITVTNNLKKFQVSTDVEEVNGVKGGTISGEDEAPYETVEYGKNSTKEIKIVPDENYKIVKITVNGENYEFTPAEDGSYTMPQFTDMQTNKHIVVTFSNTASSVLVHHYIDGTQTKVAEDEHIAGTIGENYTTAPHMDLEEYELKQVDGEYIIPENASGTFTQEEQVITYYYVKKQVPLTVHHYIEGTNESVPLATGGLAQDIVTKGEIGTEYTTEALTQEELNPKYELSIIPENASGTYLKEGVTVTYYYKAKILEVTTKVQTHKETNEMGEEVEITGGTITGQNQKPYETVIYGENSQNDIVAIPDENYQVKQIIINGEPLEFTPEEDGTVVLNKFTDMTEDKNVVVEFEKIPAKVIVHYYIEGTTDKVPLQDGGTADDVTKTGVVGDIYATRPADNVNSMYELILTPTNASGTMTKDTIEVTYYYKLKATSVLVHHYKENTTEQLSQDVTINGEVGDAYTTQVATDIPQNYELATTPSNASGTMTENQIVVTYYYRLKTPNITDQVINKTGTDRITVANQEMSYAVTYTAEINDYIGNAEVTIVDTLPYAIDGAKSDLAGGTYDSSSKTITWKENVSDINSYNGNGTVNITKNLKVVYVGLDMNQEKITNNVKGHIKLLTPEKTSDEVTGKQESTIYKAIISSEKLVDKEEAMEGEKVTYTIRITNDGNLAKTVTVRDTLPAGITFDKDTLIKVGNIDTVYTEQNLKNGIPVEVPASGSIDVVFAGKVDTLANNEYSKTLTNQATIDNEPTNEVTTEVTKANITAHKESEPSSGSKVREGDEITYKIRVRNDGTREGDVIVKDTIPTGTTFVEGSIKIDNVADSTKTATDLQNGITLNVPISTEKVIELKVRVNKLIDGTKIKNTAYINQNGEDKKVPEEPEHTYVEPKEEQNITKNGTATIESLEQEITYNINYTAKITDYSGRATVKLVDTLPYAIDEARSDLAGGTYDAQAKTITWEETVENIQITEEKEITLNKTIKVVYIGITQGTTAIKNVVTGHIEYETPAMTSDEVTANSTTTTVFTVNIPVSKVWEDDSNKLNQRPTKVVFKLHGSDGSEYTKEMSKPGTAGSTTTQDSTNPNKWNDIFENLPKYDSNNQEIVYTLTEEEKTEGDLKYYDSVVTDKTVTNTNKYGKVTVHHYIMNTDGSTTTTRVPDANGTEIPDVVIEGKEGNPYTTEEANNVNEKYELVAEKLPANATGKIEKYNEEKPQEVIYYYRLKPAKVLINYLEKDEDTDDSNNLVLTAQEQIDGHVDDVYNTDTEYKKETIEKDGKTYTLVSDSGNKTGTMTLEDITITYYYLQNTKATVRYVERNPETHEIVKDLEEPYTQEGLVGDEFVTNSKEFAGYKLVESPEETTIKMTNEEQTLIYYYEPVYTGLIENHIDARTGKILYTKTHDVQVGESYNIPSQEFEGYDLVESKLPENAEGIIGEELVTVNYYYIKKAVLEVNYIDVLTNELLTEQIVDETKHEGDEYTTEQKAFDNYDLVEVPSNATGTMTVETDEEGNITNNRTIVTYYYAKKSAGVEEHHIDILTGKDIEEPTLHEGHVGDEYDIKAKEFLSYKLVEADEEGNSMLPENSKGTMTEEKIVVNYYYNQPAKVIVHYIEKATGKELEETNPETGELQNSQVIIEGQKDDDYIATAKEFEYYTLIEKPQEEQGKMKVEITKDEEGNDVVNNTIELYYYYEAKPFNIGVEKEIIGIIVNGERRAPTNGKLEKVEIYRKSTENTSVQIEYKIKVMNTGEVSGNATIEENIPEGMKLANNDGTWEEQEGKLIKVIPELGAGETKEYTVLLNWEQTGENMGEKANEVKLVETGNVPGFVDNNDKDNTSNANVIISVETGELPIGLILALIGLVGLETITLRYAVVLTKKQRKVNKK